MMKKTILFLFLITILIGSLSSCRGVRDMNGLRKTPVKGGGWM